MKVAIASGKGGTGKTTLSTNLAGLIAETNTVMLIDLDVEEPNTGLFIKGECVHSEEKFKMIPEWTNDCSLCGLCQEVCNFHAVLKLGRQIMVFPELCHSCYACSELCPDSALPMIPQKMGILKQYQQGRLSLVESRLEIGEEQAVPLIAQTMAHSSKHINGTEFQIYDAPPGTACPVIEALKDKDFVILVTEPTPFGLHDLKLAIDTVRALHKPFGVVVNRFGIGDDEVLHYCQREAIPVVAKIPNDRRIAELYSRGSLIYRDIPEFREELENVINFLRAWKKGNMQ